MNLLLSLLQDRLFRLAPAVLAHLVMMMFPQSWTLTVVMGSRSGVTNITLGERSLLALAVGLVLIGIGIFPKLLTLGSWRAIRARNSATAEQLSFISSMFYWLGLVWLYLTAWQFARYLVSA